MYVFRMNVFGMDVFRQAAYLAKFGGYQLSKIFLALVGMKMSRIAQISERFPRII